MSSRLFALCNLLGPPSLKRFLRLFLSIYIHSLPEFFGHKQSNPVDIALLLPGFIFIPFSTAHPLRCSDPYATFLCWFYLGFSYIQGDSLARGPTEVYLHIFNEFVNQLTDDDLTTEHYQQGVATCHTSNASMREIECFF